MRACSNIEYAYGIVQSDLCNSTDLDRGRFLAKCIVGPDACSAYTWGTYFQASLGFIILVSGLALVTRGSLLVFSIAKGSDGLKANALGSTLGFLWSATIFLSIWNCKC